MAGLGNSVNFDFGESLAVAVLHAVALAALFLEDDHFVPLLMAQDRGLDLDGKHGLAHLDVPVAVHQVYLVKRYGIALSSG